MADRQNLWAILLGMGIATLVASGAFLVFVLFDRQPDRRAAVVAPESTSAPGATLGPAGPSATTLVPSVTPTPASIAVPATATPTLPPPTAKPEATAVVLLPAPTETAGATVVEQPTATATATQPPVPVDEPVLTAGAVVGIARNIVLPSGLTVLECEGKQVGRLVARYRGKGVWTVSLNLTPPNGDLVVIVNETTGATNVSSFPDAGFPQPNNC